MKTIALISQKGGVGKTTLALHLAVGWQQAGQNVAVIDLDPQASAANWGDRREEALPVVRSAHASRLEQELRAVEEAGGEIVILDTAPTFRRRDYGGHEGGGFGCDPLPPVHSGPGSPRGHT